ncbi:MAG: glycosyltransferase family 4 protein, partial [Acidimicrobiales bacterium]
MRIAQVCPYSLSIPGGVQAQVMGLARALRLLGHEAEVLAPCDGPPPDVGVTPLGRSVPFASNGSVAPIAPDLACFWRTVTALRDGGYDIVHLHEPLVPGPTVAGLAAARAPVVGTFHRVGESTLYRLLRPAAVRAAARLDLRCAVSEFARDTAAAALGGTYEVTFNGIDVERFAKAVPWPTSGPTVFFLGRHEPRKGLATLLEAMRSPLLGPDVRLWVGGDGPQTGWLRASVPADPRIEWLGRLSPAEAASRLRGAGVFCAPSLHG